MQPPLNLSRTLKNACFTTLAESSGAGSKYTSRYRGHCATAFLGMLALLKDRNGRHMDELILLLEFSITSARS